MALKWRWVFVRPDGTIDGFSTQDQDNAEADALKRGCALVSCPPEVRKASDWVWTGERFEAAPEPQNRWGWREQRAEKYPPAKDQLEGLIKAVTFMAAAYRDQPGAAEAFADLDAVAARIAALKTTHPKG
jgi:hypothetical protein